VCGLLDKRRAEMDWFTDQERKLLWETLENYLEG
jgi:hypothetical protein